MTATSLSASDAAVFEAAAALAQSIFVLGGRDRQDLDRHARARNASGNASAP